jgi:methylenetetrahydrofolate reductase (NADPH)
MTNAEILSRPRFEILPTRGAEELADYLPVDAKVAVTCSPTKGIERTLLFSERLLERGFRVVPRIAARLIAGREHLEEIVQWVDEHGLREIYVIGGDSSEPVGPYASAFQLLAAMSQQEHGVEEVGIGGYPEGHPLIDDQELDRALMDRQPFASYIVTQLCCDVDTILGWISGIRHRGIRRPVYVGLPGAVDRKKLLPVSLKPGDYSPDRLVERLAPYAGDEHYDIVGLHLYTFNQVEGTEQWRQRMLGSKKSSGTGVLR